MSSIDDADLPTAEALVRRAIGSLRKRAPARQPKHLRNMPSALWSRVGELFGHGCGYSIAICEKYGFNPYETYRPDEDGEPAGQMEPPR